MTNLFLYRDMTLSQNEIIIGIYVAFHIAVFLLFVVKILVVIVLDVIGDDILLFFPRLVVKILLFVFRLAIKTIIVFPLGIVLGVVLHPWIFYRICDILFQSIKHKHHMLTKLYIKRFLVCLTPYHFIDIWARLYKNIYNTKPYPRFINDFVDKQYDERQKIFRLYSDTPSKLIHGIIEKIDSKAVFYKEKRNLTDKERLFSEKKNS